MARIQLSTLAVCDQRQDTQPANLTYYPNIYVEAGTGINRDSAVQAYWGIIGLMGTI